MMKTVQFTRHALRYYFSFSGLISARITEGNAKTPGSVNLTDRSGTVLVTSSAVPLARFRFLGMFIHTNIIYAHADGTRIAEFGPALNGDLEMNSVSIGKLKTRKTGPYFRSLESEHFKCGFVSTATLEFEHSNRITEFEAICAAVHLGLYSFDS